MSHRGFGMVEVLIAGALVLMVFIPIVTVSIRSSELRRQTIQNTQAAFLGIEGLEAMRLVRDSGWATTSSFSYNQDYYLLWNGVAWRIATGTPPSLIDGLFDRRVRISPVYRDGGHKIVATGGVLDPDSRSISVSVAWKTKFGTTTKSSSTYLINIFP